MTKVPYHDQEYGGAQVAAYLTAQSVVQRLNAVVPSRRRQDSRSARPAGRRRAGRKRAAAAGIAAYLYTAPEPVVPAIGPHHRQVKAIRRTGKSDLLVISAITEQWLRHGYATRMRTEAVRRDLGEILAHGEP
jgi:hypothetical protein